MRVREGHQRLRVGPFRILFRRERDAIYCIFGERRGIVYEVFAEMLQLDR